jgi:hypothetical protein
VDGSAVSVSDTPSSIMLAITAIVEVLICVRLEIGILVTVKYYYLL